MWKWLGLPRRHTTSFQRQCDVGRQGSNGNEWWGGLVVTIYSCDENDEKDFKKRFFQWNITSRWQAMFSSLSHVCFGNSNTENLHLKSHVVLFRNFDVFLCYQEICQTVKCDSTNTTNFQATIFETRCHRILQKHLRSLATVSFFKFR